VSQENVEIVRRGFDAFNRLGQVGDLAALIDEFYDADVVWEGADDAPDRGPFRGRDEVLAHVRSWSETLDAFRSEPEEIVDAGEKVVVVQYSHGILKGSNAEVGVRFASVWEVRGGRIVSVKQYQHRAEALKAVGLEE
jgi:ketosteroid isomerase-like protein